MIDITGLDRAKIIQALYSGAKAQGMSFIHYENKPLDYNEAESLIDRSIDYLKGRVMKVKISSQSNEFDERLFDRDNGQGCANTLINDLRGKVKA